MKENQNCAAPRCNEDIINEVNNFYYEMPSLHTTLPVLFFLVRRCWEQKKTNAVDSSHSTTVNPFVVLSITADVHSEEILREAIRLLHSLALHCPHLAQSTILMYVWRSTELIELLCSAPCVFIATALAIR